MVWPVLMLVTLGVLQAGLWLHGRNVAQRAATAAVDVARGSAGSVEAAREAGAELARSGGLDGVSVEVVRGADRGARPPSRPPRRCSSTSASAGCARAPPPRGNGSTPP